MTNYRREHDIRVKQMFLPFARSDSRKISAGTFRRAEPVREAFSATLKDCPLSPEIIAEEMSRLTGEEITKNHISNWSAESKSKYRMPLQVVAAFCVVTNDNRTIKAAFEGTGINILDDSEMVFFEIGKAAEEQRESAARLKAERDRLKMLRMRGEI